MSENKKGFMDGIITVKDALRWFDYTSKTGYRKPNECDFRLGNEPEKYFFGLNGFEPDSSPIAWIHYNKHYTEDTFGACKDEPSHSKNFTDEDRKYSFSNGKLGYSGRKPNIRLHAIPKWYFNSLFTRANRNKQTFDASGIERLGGDCDFNFNESRASAFLRVLDDISPRRKVDLQKYFKEPKDDNMELLRECHNTHHTLLNFSLMQGVGNLQGIKRCCDSERFDHFLRYLNSYFQISKNDEAQQIKKLQEKKQPYHKSKKNIQVLSHYLNTFRVDENRSDNMEPTESLKNYCAKIYFLPTESHYTGMMEEKDVNPDNLNDKTKDKWNDLLEYNKNLIDDLLKLGSTSLTEDNSVQLKFSYQNEEKEYSLRDRVVEYMLLAVRFWQAKEKYFKLMDKVLEETKNQ